MTTELDNQKIHCLNCGTTLQGRFCHICGQEDTKINLTLKDLIHDFLSDIFSFDSRIVRTLIPLIFRPGYLTREFFRGRRVPYVPPLRLYLFISFILFLCLGMIDMNQTMHLDELGSLKSIQNIREVVITGLQENNAPAFIISIAGKSLENLVQIASNPGAFMGLLISRLPYLMFLLLPVFALLLWLHFPSSHLNYPQFLVFSLHYHAFAALLNFIFVILQTTLNFSIGFYVMTIVYFYTAISMYVALNSSITGCLLKTFVFLPAYLLVLNIGLFIFMLFNVLSFN